MSFMGDQCGIRFAFAPARGAGGGGGRHGQSEYNLQQKIGGDSSLTAHGREYAVALAKHVHECAIAPARPLPARSRGRVGVVGRVCDRHPAMEELHR